MHVIYVNYLFLAIDYLEGNMFTCGVYRFIFKFHISCSLLNRLGKSLEEYSS